MFVFSHDCYSAVHKYVDVYAFEASTTPLSLSESVGVWNGRGGSNNEMRNGECGVRNACAKGTMNCNQGCINFDKSHELTRGVMNWQSHE